MVQPHSGQVVLVHREHRVSFHPLPQPLSLSRFGLGPFRAGAERVGIPLAPLYLALMDGDTPLVVSHSVETLLWQSQSAIRGPSTVSPYIPSLILQVPLEGWLLPGMNLSSVPFLQPSFCSPDMPLQPAACLALVFPWARV